MNHSPIPPLPKMSMPLLRAMEPSDVRLIQFTEGRIWQQLGTAYGRLPDRGYEAKQVLLVDPANCTSQRAVLIQRLY